MIDTPHSDSDIHQAASATSASRPGYDTDIATVVAPYEIEEPDDDDADKDDNSVGLSIGSSTSSNASAVVRRLWQKELLNSIPDLECYSEPDGSTKSTQRGEKRKKSGPYLLRRHSSYTGSNSKRLGKRRRKSKEKDKEERRHGPATAHAPGRTECEQFTSGGGFEDSSMNGNSPMRMDSDGNPVDVVDVDAMDIS